MRRRWKVTVGLLLVAILLVPLSGWSQVPPGRVSGTYVNVDLRQVILELAGQARVSVMLEDQVQGTVTIRLINVPFEDALNVLLGGRGLTFKRVRGIYVVASPEILATRYPDTAVLEVFRLKYADPQFVVEILRQLFGLSERTIVADVRQRQVIVNALAEQLTRVRQAIELLDRPRPQVFIDVKVVEMVSSELRQLGITWGSSFGLFLPIPSPSPETIAPGLNEIWLVSPPLALLTATLQTLQEQGRARILASPRVLTLDGAEARLITAEEIPVTILQIVGGQAVRTIQTFTAGVSLTVTPRITEDNRIELTVQPTVRVITGTTPEGFPQISTRELQARVVIADGQPIMLGELVDQRTIEIVSKLPILGDLPILGALFRTRRTQKVDTNIAIIVTPKIVQVPQMPVPAPSPTPAP
jgi:type II secretory pathway component GspD/PulD (secretin)